VAGAAPVEAPGAAATPTESTPASAGLPAGPASIDTIDYNALYDETAEGKLNTGNLVLGGLIALAVVGGGGYVLWNERRRRRGRAQSAAPVTLSVAEAPTSAGKPAAASTSPDGSPDQAEMLLAIAALDPLGRRSLGQLLRDPATASDLLRRLARLDPEVVRTVRGLDRETRALLLALTSD
jgi:uncharacterized membrane protein YebE (DUF533 family)